MSADMDHATIEASPCLSPNGRRETDAIALASSERLPAWVEAAALSHRYRIFRKAHG